MRTYRCVCQARIFFDNSQCLTCGRELGFCPACRQLVGLVDEGAGNLHCGNAECGAALAKCANYSRYNVCNRCVLTPTTIPDELCDCCRFNATIPDLNVPGNWLKWCRLEAAKRRLFYDLSELGLPYGNAADGIDPPLRFDFKADVIPEGDVWRSFGRAEKVFTGHDHGTITINIREADDVEREKQRVNMGEAQRTLIGHFRHEIGHFYWDVLVQGRREEAFKAIFGDHNHPSYAEALASHYAHGPKPGWQQRYISAYASMHPWEDFAETWATYLDMVSALDTAAHMGLAEKIDPRRAELETMVSRYQRLGIAMNEINRSLGLLDVVPEVFVPAAIDKLHFIHDLVQAGRAENKALQTSSAG